MARLLQNWPRNKVELVVVSDGSRIRGAGDLSVACMPILAGKLNLYCAAAGFRPGNL
jgi:malic enzyme